VKTVVSVVRDLIRLDGASHITIRGLLIEAGRGSAVLVRGGSNERVVAGTIRNMGNWAVKVYGGTSHGVVGCDIYQLGDGGVSMSGGDRSTLTPGNHAAVNNHAYALAQWSRCYQPAFLLNGVGLRVAHNLIHDHPHCAILFWGNGFTIEYNEIHHVCLETGDVGAIYTGRDYTFRDNVVRYNFIHHTGGVGMGSMGVYNDDCVSGTAMIGNVFYRATRAAICARL
jgi:hypothetical protein